MPGDRIETRSAEYRRHVEELGFLDCNLWLGKASGFPLSRKATIEDIREVMSNGPGTLRGGFLSHWRGLTLSAQAGNGELLGELESLPENLFTIWTGLPLFPEDAGPLPGMEKPHPNMAGVRLFPKSHGFNLEPWVIDSLAEWLEDHRLPLFLWHSEIDWKELHGLAAGRPKLTIVLETQREKILYHTRLLFSLMRACSNVFVEISNLAGPGYLEYAAREFGANRLLYGSFFPMNDPLVSMGMLVDADIGEDEKRLIAGENALRMLKERRP
jgi:predicted TIM-barrel fold metal-dependent hydrolase